MLRSDMERRTATLNLIVDASLDDLGGLYRPLLAAPAERAAAGLREAVPAVAGTYGEAAGQQAVSWFEEVRSTASTYRPRVFVPPTLTEVAGLTTWAVTPLFTGDTAATWERLAGLLQKAVTDFDRVTIQENAQRDPTAGRWRRQAQADACAFCAYMAVVLDQPGYQAAAQKYHDHCHCVPVPAFAGDTALDQPNGEEWAQTFESARQSIIDERNAHPIFWSLRRGARIRTFPHLQVNTENILARARRIAPNQFRDGVRAVA